MKKEIIDFRVTSIIGLLNLLIKNNAIEKWEKVKGLKYRITFKSPIKD